MTQTHLPQEPPAEPLVARGNGTGNAAGAQQKLAKKKYGRVRYLLSKTKLHAPIRWVRHRGLRPSDIFFGSYPRSGSTWSRFVLYELLTGREAGFEAVNRTLLSVQRLNHGIAVLPNDGRMVGSHEQYQREYKRAIFLVRDCRDVMLSEYAYLTSLRLYRQDFDEFVAGFVGARSRVNGFGPWQQHAGSWLDSPIAGTDNFLLMQFENLRRNPEDSFQRICDFLGVKVSREAVQKALANNSINRMREKERNTPQLPAGKDSFIRSGSVAGWRGKLTESQLALIDEYAGSVLVRLGYPLSTGIQEPATISS
jgi:hypothetical protein